MGAVTAQWLLGISITSVCLAAISVAVSLNAAFRSTRARNYALEALRTPPSHAKLTELQEQVTHWSSISEKLASLVQKSNSRAAMRVLREKNSAAEEPADTPTAPAPPPPLPETATKEEKQAHKLKLRRFYGLNVAHTDFVRRAKLLETQKAAPTEGNSNG